MSSCRSPTLRGLAAHVHHSGTQLTIEAKGNFTKEDQKKAYVDLSIKYGLIRIINQRADLCDQMKNIDEECPLEGDKTITKNVDLPKEIPPVRFYVFLP